MFLGAQQKAAKNVLKIYIAFTEYLHKELENVLKSKKYCGHICLWEHPTKDNAKIWK